MFILLCFVVNTGFAQTDMWEVCTNNYFAHFRIKSISLYETNENKNDQCLDTKVEFDREGRRIKHTSYMNCEGAINHIQERYYADDDCFADSLHLSYGGRKELQTWFEGVKTTPKEKVFVSHQGESWAAHTIRMQLNENGHPIQVRDSIHQTKAVCVDRYAYHSNMFLARHSNISISSEQTNVVLNENQQIFYIEFRNPYTDINYLYHYNKSLLPERIEVRSINKSVEPEQRRVRYVFIEYEFYQ